MALSHDTLCDLDHGLILRRGRPEDAAELAAFNGYIFRNRETQEPAERMNMWTTDLMTNHPTVTPGDFTIVEDTLTRKIVSSFVWLSQKWSYGGIEFGVGRPEMVGTHPDYRGRGLVRAQFEAAHAYSAQRGELMQAITGIPYFYRQFGYEMTMQLGGRQAGYHPQVPKLKPDQAEPYRLRRATQEDVPFLMDLYHRRAQRYLVDCVREDSSWRYELNRKNLKNVTRMEFRIIETLNDVPVGMLAHSSSLWNQTLGVALYELIPNLSWVDVTPSVLRYLWATGEAYYERDRKEPMGEFSFELGLEHPVYSAMADHLPQKSQGYAWYLRVPDLTGFLQHIKPVLERNLEQSVVCGYTGELKLNFYRSGVRLTLAAGRIVDVAAWQPTPDDEGGAAFPDLTFLRLLFGWRTLEELRHEFADCWASNNTNRALVEALFPRRSSSVWPVA
ncbi:MAG TPA: GNAT family N-acetyltransferase [Anaerolineae bacterium]|jgi:hypothetical protein